MKRLALVIAAMFAAVALAASFAPAAGAHRGGGPKGYGPAYADKNGDGVCDRKQEYPKSWTTWRRHDRRRGCEWRIKDMKDFKRAMPGIGFYFIGRDGDGVCDRRR